MTTDSAADVAPPDLYDCVIVGGGIAGLSAAWHLRHRRIAVLESEPRAGGKVLSEQRSEYWLNLGAHLFPPPGTALGELIADVGLSTVRIPGATLAVWAKGKLLTTGRPATYPFRLPLQPSARLSLLRAGVQIHRAVAQYRALAVRAPEDTDAAIRARLLGFMDDRSFMDYLGPLHPDVAAIVRAAINRVSAEPEELAAGAGAAQFLATFSGSGQSLHRNLLGGAALLPEAISRALGDRLRTGARVTRVVDTGDKVEVEYEEATGIRRLMISRTAIVATPAHVALEIAPHVDAQLGDALGAVAYGPYVVAAILTNERRPMPWDSLYAIVVAEKSFNMFFNMASVLRTTGLRRDGGSLMVYGASNLARRLEGVSDSEVENRFLSDLEDVFPGTRDVVQEIKIQRWQHGIPFSRPGRHKWQPIFERTTGNLFLAGDYIGERGGMDTASFVGREAARKADAAIPAR